MLRSLELVWYMPELGWYVPAGLQRERRMQRGCRGSGAAAAVGMRTHSCCRRGSARRSPGKAGGLVVVGAIG